MKIKLIVNKEQSIDFLKINQSTIKSIQRLGSCYLEDYLNKYIIFIDGILIYTNNDEVFYDLYKHIPIKIN